MLCGLKFALACSAIAAALVDAALEDVPSFTVPSFDYTSLQNGDAPDRMLQALERGGIIALRNIPNYANVRERFLASAVQCAVASEDTDDGARYLSTKQFHDGTRRLTLRAAAGRELMDTDTETLNAMAANCPGHRELYEEFSSTLERAVDTFASVLDQTEFKMGDGERHVSARKLIGDAKRLDHFHAYEAAPASTTSTRRSLSAQEIERDLSLAMHEDHGLFIAMAAPKFFSVSTNENIHERRLTSDASGLVIGAAELDEIVRPDLKDDELVLMMGTGASRWLETSHHLPAVMHGMRMPEEMVWDDESTPGQRNLRAWFGKMTLLPSYQRLLETKMDFDEFTNRTTRHLLASGDTNDDLKAIGCAGGRHLVESEGSCTYSICTLRPGMEKPPTVGCSQACNYHTEFFDAKCEKKCDCTSTTTQADVCWMLCVARLPVNECALEDQQCSGLKIICLPNSTDSNTTATPAHTHAPVPTTQPTVVTEAPTTAPPATAEPSTRLPTDATTPSSTTATPIETSIPSTLPPIATLTLALAPTTIIPTKAPSPSATETPTEMPITQDSPTQEPVLPGGYC
ncbi:hypothetical protein JG687_00002049 [Phytophthora cactorum]|uniref:Uncharacterized protein n=1 Tax=Phytophthora cactorum TaxID=29920 RepID=A0A329SU55_9STRA|nr:Isopenicillin N synthase-like [Phytophthora cactorum]KAG2772828.1 hypothetical protein Pcac1_g16186 [Phytophthora cactorum]KAG2844857.1 hypothetical protein PC111_g1813 [Phytophthora cactorum]KAG2848216.1 hypothetical protein PC112_g773 [Phytophthora cactorum]KAG2868502.1 hypothetical protein PC113_g961 [Phytophthora cactorum]